MDALGEAERREAQGAAIAATMRVPWAAMKPMINCPGADVAENQFALRRTYSPGPFQLTGSIVLLQDAIFRIPELQQKDHEPLSVIVAMYIRMRYNVK